ncbi:MAG TPA: hypothetical protein VFD01_18565 [Candidatus Dormibacteraeota bacterium]|jgi:cytochrome bd-type quinol oxidase subunit 1|nr:hypothetical protein [Candidatus Dormibacteraeota bacterium]
MQQYWLVSTLTLVVPLALLPLALAWILRCLRRAPERSEDGGLGEGELR